MLFVLVFTLGWIANSAFSYYQNLDLQKPSFLGLVTANELKSPSDHIKEDQIKVFPDKVVIKLEDASWAGFTDTNSMDPIIDAGSNSIEIVPQNPSEIKVGDIISYNADFVDGIVIHRVMETGQDQNGWYCKVKGDNNAFRDPQKVRFEQIVGMVVAVIY